MKLAVSTLACPKWTLSQIVESVSTSGIRGIDLRGLGDEIDITRLPAFNENLPETLGLLRDHGIELSCLNTSVTLVTPAPERWQMMLEEAQRNARLAEKTHTRHVRVFGGAAPKEMSHDQALYLAQRHLRQLVKICGAFGCVPLVETHDEWSTSAAMLQLIHEFDPEETGVLWDIEHSCRRGEAPDDTQTPLRRYIRHVHWKDSLRIDGKSSPRLIGEGDLPIRQCHALLRESGYEGWICLETEKRWYPSAPEPEQSIPQFARFMRELAADPSGR